MSGCVIEQSCPVVFRRENLTIQHQDDSLLTFFTFFLTFFTPAGLAINITLQLNQIIQIVISDYTDRVISDYTKRGISDYTDSDIRLYR